MNTATLREYRIRDGRPYFRGYLGQTKLLAFRDDRAEYVSASLQAHV
jgi:hypothetical protein